MKTSPLLFAGLAVAVLGACRPPDGDTDLGVGVEPRRAGDADAGWDVLRYGDFVGSGVPKDVWFSLIPPLESNLLEREGDAAGIPSAFNLFEAPNGVEVVGGITCLGCHAGVLQGQFVPGLGGYGDYTSNDASTFEVAALAVETQYGRDSAEWDAFYPLLRGARAIAPHVEAPMAGVNPAFSMERAAVAYRDPDSLEWVTDGQPVFDIPDQVLACDVPAWWNVKKKSRLYYTGAGQGDRATLISQISVVGLTDAPQFDAIADSMVDVVAWLDALEPPVYPEPVDAAAADAGQGVFEAQCASCHGTYADDPADETYPDLVVPLDEVGTDPVYAMGFLEPPGFTAWLQGSHLASSDHPARFEPSEGYVAPPLDGVWATAPYLHNGSVPTLTALLDSSLRPLAWQRQGFDLDLEAGGVYWVPVDTTGTEPGTLPPEVYDTRVTSFGNGGHRFADALTEAQRSDLLAYLKTL